MYFKFLAADGRSPFAYCNWHLPVRLEDGTQIPGQWMPPVVGPLRLCENGYHAARVDHLFHWLRRDMYELEFRDPSEVIDDGHGGRSYKVAGRKARLVRRIDGLTNEVLKEQAILALEDALRAKRARSPRALDLARAILATVRGESPEWTYDGLRNRINEVQRCRYGGPSSALLYGCWDLLDMAFGEYEHDRWRPGAFAKLAEAMPDEHKALTAWGERLLARLGVEEVTTAAV